MTMNLRPCFWGGVMNKSIIKTVSNAQSALDTVAEMIENELKAQGIELLLFDISCNLQAMTYRAEAKGRTPDKKRARYFRHEDSTLARAVLQMLNSESNVPPRPEPQTINFATIELVTGNTMMPDTNYSIEKLIHFRCMYPDCGKWWTIGDAPTDRNYFCPWCGQLHSGKKANGRCQILSLFGRWKR